MACTTWDSELTRLIKEHWRVGAVFTAQEVYDFEAHFRRIYPRNAHPQQKLRQTLQHLRDSGVLDFLDDHGTYKRIS